MSNPNNINTGQGAQQPGPVSNGAQGAAVKQKKPFWKKWWFWLVVVIVVLAMVVGGNSGNSGNGGTSTSATGTTQSQQSQTTDNAGSDAKTGSDAATGSAGTDAKADSTDTGTTGSDANSGSEAEKTPADNAASEQQSQSTEPDYGKAVQVCDDAAKQQLFPNAEYDSDAILGKQKWMQSLSENQWLASYNVKVGAGKEKAAVNCLVDVSTEPYSVISVRRGEWA